MQYAFWITTGINVALVAAFFVGKTWLKASVERSVQHKFDDRIETLRTELRKNEESFKSELRTKEHQITVLRDALLSGRAHRQTLLDKRRLEAIERIWNAVATSPFKVVSEMMASVKFENAAQEAPRDPNTREFFKVIASMVGENAPSPNSATSEQPFVSPLAWAYFRAHQTIVYGAFSRARMLSIGVKGAENMLKTDTTRNIIKAALPHYTEFIDKQDVGAHHYLLEEIESKLLA